MTLDGFNMVKIAAQDDPITVDHLRILRENVRFRRKLWENQIFSCVWGPDDAGSTATTYNAPPVWFKGGAVNLRFVICYDGTAGTDLTLRYYHGDDENYHTLTFASSSGVHVRETTLSIENTEIFSQTDRLERFKISNGNLTKDLYYFAVFADYGDVNEDPTDNETSPEFYEVADDSQAAQIAAGINNFHKTRKFLGGWLGDFSMPQKTLPYTGEQFYLFSIWDETERAIGDEKAHALHSSIDGNGAVSGYNENYLSNADATDTKTRDHYPESVAGFIEQFSTGNVEELSFNTSSPYSVVKWNWAKTGDLSNLSILKGCALIATFPDLATGRTQGTNATGVDLDHYDIDAGENITLDTINALGRAQFNQICNARGNQTAFITPDGYALTLQTSLTSEFYLPVVLERAWAINAHENSYIYLDVAMLIENETGSSFDIEYYFADDNDQSATQGETLATGYNYITATGLNWEMSDSLDSIIANLVELFIRSKSGSTENIKIWSIVITPSFGDLTY